MDATFIFCIHNKLHTCSSLVSVEHDTTTPVGWWLAFCGNCKGEKYSFYLNAKARQMRQTAICKCRACIKSKIQPDRDWMSTKEELVLGKHWLQDHRELPVRCMGFFYRWVNVVQKVLFGWFQYGQKLCTIYNIRTHHLTSLWCLFSC
jgi:hypothetical protein